MHSKILEEADYELIQSFQCEDEPTVGDFLHEQALRFQHLNLASTRLFFDDKHKLVGYYTLYNDMMEIGKEKRRKHGMEDLPSFKFYPAVKLHYLGVDSRYRKKGYGRYLLLHSLDTAEKISQISGCLFMSVESLPNCMEFYLLHEFQVLSYSKPLTNMFFKLGEL
ncbi:GNAT family N-acetyltransferase [Paenibacillus sp. FSL L8-0435]|uniref:GNAT family N-acetyltransferase n=1 Tax=Paenibacillus sp. FSL L8-0435 TaxID=2954618 RepID=UPI0030D7D153